MKKGYERSKSLKASKKTGKSQTYDREYSREQRLQKENEKLKKQVKQLRKIIEKMDFERYYDMREMIENQEKIEKEAANKASKKKRDEEKWRCFQCGTGVLRLKTIEIRDGVRYYRKCDMCPHRTKAKKMNKSVEGVE